MDIRINNERAYISNDISGIVGEVEVGLGEIGKIIAGRNCRVILENTEIDISYLMDIGKEADVYVKGVTSLYIRRGKVIVERKRTAELIRVQQRILRVIKVLADNTVDAKKNDNQVMIARKTNGKIFVRGYFDSKNKLKITENEIVKEYGKVNYTSWNRELFWKNMIIGFWEIN
jgi:hypothetical protein